VMLQYSDLYNRNLTRQFDKAPPEGETINEVIERVNRVFDSIEEKYRNENILIVTHAFVSRVIHKYFNKINDVDFFAYSLKNCEVAEYRI
ncbi:histidine phosphatase family protein, partial [candidate division WOR-3 bacterium]|nr:histidine phosphatase family protein [candidate division WOR-3 bacterium]